ncbi:hypothetical protein DKX38_017308 [Salix brachista]|uniref:non-specific serine/threonine protein kinase n=1 Tax=Salix brachista TaxID=2182728 RepID=A0A5N5KV23_9ROSI|nr:hypothetical protein DKX38_017308 [Salix brachista]
MSNGILVLCAADYRSFHINCGGQDVKNGTILYEGDLNIKGSAAATNYHRLGSNWGFSSTGDFMNDGDFNDDKYTLRTNISPVVSELYTTARRTPLSITYYGYCLENGDYTVRLHFAEIQFTDEIPGYKVARRVFDIYIQVTELIVKVRIELYPYSFNVYYRFDGMFSFLCACIFIQYQNQRKQGELADGTIIAVKQLSSKSRQGNREFVNEIGMISCLQHPNLVNLYGCCIEGDQLLVVYEYMENNSLASALFGSETSALVLDWPTRYKICVGIARGLTFLHEGSAIRIVHRDIKGTNVLLDKDLNAKISDFGLAKLNEEENTHISTRVAGTMPENKNVCLLDWAFVLQKKGNLMEVVDPKLQSEFNKEEAERMIKLALLCTNASPSLRPAMSEVASMLEGQTSIPEIISDPSIYGDDLHSTRLTGHYQQARDHSLNSTRGLFPPSDKSWNGKSSTSAHDLYPVNPESMSLNLSETSSLIE